MRIEILDGMQQFAELPWIAFRLREIAVERTLHYRVICEHGVVGELVVKMETLIVRTTDEGKPSLDEVCVDRALHDAVPLALRNGCSERLKRRERDVAMDGDHERSRGRRHDGDDAQKRCGTANASDTVHWRGTPTMPVAPRWNQGKRSRGQPIGRCGQSVVYVTAR